jgi:ADP-dependent NAD(P)H-hydrate dehydratase / NAD(P)H-hydrate epimerase
MKIFSAAQIRAWDAATIEGEPVSSLALMNRAAQVFVDWFVRCCPDAERPVCIVAGTGNNGGDGVAAARLLQHLAYTVHLYIADFSGKQSPDFQAQMENLPLRGTTPRWLDPAKLLPDLPPDAVLIDALFGSGLTRPPEGPWAALIAQINRLPNEVVAIDLPSGLFADAFTPGPCVLARRTFGFETPKRAFFFPENAERVGEWAYGSIGLLPAFAAAEFTPYYYTTPADAADLVVPRPKFGHKGTFGHALLVAGSYGKMGAAALAARACLRAGAGLLSVCAPRCGHDVLQTAVPEAMYIPDGHERHLTEAPDLTPYAAVGIGCGLGSAPETAMALAAILENAQRPLVLDADALNLLARYPEWWPRIPENSILTPHPGEFERLFGKTADDFERNDLQRAKAREHRVFILLKGAHSALACPDGDCRFNSTGNPGMATGGSGDVLAGILTGLLAQGYDPRSAAVLGVYLHGLAGDLAAQKTGEQALIAGDLVAHLGAAWLDTCTTYNQ